MDQTQRPPEVKFSQEETAVIRKAKSKAFWGSTAPLTGIAVSIYMIGCKRRYYTYSRFKLAVVLGGGLLLGQTLTFPYVIKEVVEKCPDGQFAQMVEKRKKGTLMYEGQGPYTPPPTSGPSQSVPDPEMGRNYDSMGLDDSKRPNMDLGGLDDLNRKTVDSSEYGFNETESTKPRTSYDEIRRQNRMPTPGTRQNVPWQAPPQPRETPPSPEYQQSKPVRRNQYGDIIED